MIANTTTRALRPVMTRTVVNQRRHAGGTCSSDMTHTKSVVMMKMMMMDVIGHFLKKNLYVEENAGIRENSYKTW
eukprot:scaffold998_cov162-Ochromonas_danica.AAC.1